MSLRYHQGRKTGISITHQYGQWVAKLKIRTPEPDDRSGRQLPGRAQCPRSAAAGAQVGQSPFQSIPEAGPCIGGLRAAARRTIRRRRLPTFLGRVAGAQQADQAEGAGSGHELEPGERGIQIPKGKEPILVWPSRAGHM